MSLMSVLAVAVSISGAPIPPSTVRCEATGAQFITIRSSTRTLSARIHLARQAPGLWVSGYVAPSAGLLFVLPGKSNYAGVQVYVNPYEPDKLKITLAQPGFNGGHINFAIAPVDATVSISAQLENGKLTVTADGLHQTAKVDDKVIDHAVLMCSHGVFDFSLADGLTADTPTRQ